MPAISRLDYETVRHVSARDYTPRQFEAWAPEVPPESFWKERFPRRTVFVAEDKNKVVGFAELEDSGYSDCFHVHHARQGEGIGSQLLVAIERRARAENLALLFAEVSITARPFFEAGAALSSKSARKPAETCGFTST